jgi:hypothetical protein
MTKVMWTLTWFDKRTDEWIGEVRLRGVKLAQLQKLFGEPSNNPMVDSFKVEKKQLQAIQDWAGVPVVPAKFDYFVECSAVEVRKAVAVTR